MVERTGHSSRFWQRGFRLLYRTLGLVEPSIRAQWATFGLGNVVQVTISGRRSGQPRSVLLGELAANGRLYLGHPNGPAEWTRNLDAAGGWLMIARSPGAASPWQAILLAAGPERDAVIKATGQHPFPGNLIYRLARGHVQAVGRYYRLEPKDEVQSSTPTVQAGDQGAVAR